MITQSGKLVVADEYFTREVDVWDCEANSGEYENHDKVTINVTEIGTLFIHIDSRAREGETWKHDHASALVEDPRPLIKALVEALHRWEEYYGQELK